MKTFKEIALNEGSLDAIVKELAGLDTDIEWTIRVGTRLFPEESTISIKPKDKDISDWNNSLMFTIGNEQTFSIGSFGRPNRSKGTIEDKDIKKLDKIFKDWYKTVKINGIKVSEQLLINLEKDRKLSR